MPSDDKRVKARVPLREKVQLKVQDMADFITEYADNISIGGMFIRTSKPFPTGTRFDLDLTIGSDGKKITGIGEVVWTKEFTSKADDRNSGMGIKFVELYGNSKAIIKELVDKCMKE